MTAYTRTDPSFDLDPWLGRLGIAWFAIAAFGQIAFILFIAGFYGPSTLTGDFASWNNKQLITGHVPGDTVGNAMFAAHVLLAAVMTAGGLAQLVPAVRNRARGFHRWNGRVFLALACFLALGGIWMGWVRGAQLSTVSAVAVSLNGVLILVFAGFALHFAMARRIADHQRWAMRLFMAASGVWFLRVGLMGWVLVNQGPVGMNATLSGPADIALVFGCYLIPLAGLELYMAARRSESGILKALALAMVGALTIFMCIGIFGAIMFMWT